MGAVTVPKLATPAGARIEFAVDRDSGTLLPRMATGRMSPVPTRDHGVDYAQQQKYIREAPMQAVRCSEGRVRVVDVPEPGGEGISVRIRSAGICGSDLHMIAGGFPVPHTLGHEMAGELSDGTAVAIEPLTPCGTCDCCRTGDYNLCRIGPAMVMGVGCDGGMAEEILVPERCLVPLPSGINVRDACLIEPLAVAACGLARVESTAHSSALVVGGGAIGLCAVAAAAAGGLTVHLDARHEPQREAGRRLGGESADAARREYDLEIDCAGTTASLERCVDSLRPGGMLLLLATYWAGLTLPSFGVTGKAISIVASSMYARRGLVRDVDAAATILARNPEIARALITHRMPLEAAPEAFEIAAQRSNGAIKVVLEPAAK
jgi:threonine dehydrogenase-like Zn-dependent dehydrogenase